LTVVAAGATARSTSTQSPRALRQYTPARGDARLERVWHGATDRRAVRRSSQSRRVCSWSMRRRRRARSRSTSLSWASICWPSRTQGAARTDRNRWLYIRDGVELKPCLRGHRQRITARDPAAVPARRARKRHR
jgi:hypothetical protein